MRIYLIPGLGFDNRIFEKLDLSHFDVNYINWINPNENESIKDYTKRLSKDIKDSEETILIGHSLGGIISQEISLIKQIDKIILLSSIKSEKENPLHFKLVKPFYIHKCFTKELSNKTIKFWGKWFDYETVEEQDFFNSMIAKHSNEYLQWALKTLSIWKSPKLPLNTKIFQIHGDLDKNFPLKKIVNVDKIIKDAGHFMVYKHPEKISQAIIEGIYR